MALLPPERELARLRLVRAAVVQGATMRSVQVAEGLLVESGLSSWLRGRMDYQCWPPTLAAVDGAIAAAERRNSGREQRRAAGARPMPAVRRMVAVAAAHCGVSPEKVLGKRRFPSLVRARRAVVFAISRVWPHFSLPQVAAQVGFLDHSSVHYHKQQAVIACGRDADFASLCARLIAMGRGGDEPLPADVLARLEDIAHAARAKAEAEEVTTAALAADPDDARAAAVLGDGVLGTDRLAARQLGRADFCDQCDQLVSATRAAACRDQFCSLRCAA